MELLVPEFDAKRTENKKLLDPGLELTKALVTLQKSATQGEPGFYLGRVNLSRLLWCKRIPTLVEPGYTQPTYERTGSVTPMCSLQRMARLREAFTWHRGL